MPFPTTAYLLTYDKQPGRNYGPLIHELRRLGCVSPAESVWFGRFTVSAPRIRQHLLPLLGFGGRLVIGEMKEGSDWATHNAAEGGADWLSWNVTPAEPKPIGTGLAPSPLSPLLLAMLTK